MVLQEMQSTVLYGIYKQKKGKPVWKLLNLNEPKPAVTAYTISLSTPEK